MEDLIDTDLGKHDYDWLLTPPDTPKVTSPKACDQEMPSLVPNIKSTRSASTTRASTVASSQSQNTYSTKTTGNSSVTRPSIIRTNNSLTNINALKTKLTLNSHAISPRHQTSTKAKPTLKTQNTNSNSSSPRLHTSSNSSSPRLRTSSNSTPKASDHQVLSPVLKSKPLRSVSTTRASKVPSTQSQYTHPTKLTRSSSVTRSSIQRTNSSMTNNNELKKSNPSLSSISSKPSTPRFSTLPSLKAKPQNNSSNSLSPRLHSNSSSNSIQSRKSSNHQRTKQTNRSTSTGRPSRALVHPIEILNLPSGGPIIHRSSSVGTLHTVVSGVCDNKSLEHSPLAQLQKNAGSEGGARRSNKSGSGFGRNLSKNSIDMALRHMDIKQSIGGIRSKTIIPAIIRSNSQKSHASVKENTKYHAIASPNSVDAIIKSPKLKPPVAGNNDSDFCASTQYDAMLSIEDANNSNWLHSTEDKSDQSVVFDHGFEPLPEPFDLPDS